MPNPVKIKLNLLRRHFESEWTGSAPVRISRLRRLLSSSSAIALGLAFVAGMIMAQERTDPRPERWEVLFQQGHLEEAKNELQNALKENPNSIAQLVSLSRVLLVADDFDRATDQVRHALGLTPSNPDALTLYGHCLFREGNFKLAETQYRKSLRLDPRQAGAHLGLGRLYLTKLQPTQSIEAFQNAIDLAPNEEDHYFFASEAYGVTKNYSKQVECLEKYLSLKPKFSEERVQNAGALLTFFRSLENQPVARIAEPARSYVIPFQPFYGLMLVEVQVNGKGPYPFVLHAFTKVLLEGDSGYRLSDIEDRETYEAVENLFVLDQAQRRLFTLANLLPRALGARLHKWIEGGRYASMFDNPRDTLPIDRLQVFDFESMREYPSLLEPLLFYVLHRVNERVHDPAEAGSLKVCVMDEAWRLIQHPTLRAYVQEALKTWRKRNAAVLLATQSIDDFASADLLRTVVESCPTRLLLANPSMDRRQYADLFQMNEMELDVLSGLAPRQQVLLKRPSLAKVLTLRVDPKSYWIYTNTPIDNERVTAVLREYGLAEGIDRLAASA